MTDKKAVYEPLVVNTNQTQGLGLGNLPKWFTEPAIIGCGVTGLVFSATDTRAQVKVAIKKLSFSSHRQCQLGLREIKLLRQLKHDNIISVREILDPGGKPIGSRDSSLECAYIIQELLDTDLSRLIASGQLTGGHCKLISYQILRGLKYIHSANVIHRDLKPSNVMVNCENLMVKIGDFGLARVVDPAYDHRGHLTENVGSCWYKAPEVILAPGQYSEAVDLWAMGCILGEMLLQRPVFAGSNEVHQLLKVIDTLHLTDADWSMVLKVMPNKLLKNQPLRPRNPLSRLLSHLDAPTFNLLERLLAFDPKSRPSAVAALNDEYLADYHHPLDEPSAQMPFHIEHEVDMMPASLLRAMIVRESCCPPSSCGSYCAPPDLENSCSQQLDPLPNSTPLAPASSEEDMMHTLDQIISSGEESNDDQLTAVEAKNLRNSCRVHSPNIFEVDASVKKESVEKSDEDEKDVVEMSAAKIAEDAEVGNSLQQPQQQQPQQEQKQQPQPEKVAPRDRVQTENKVASKPRDSNRSRRNSGNRKAAATSASKKEPERICSRKLIMDKIESEKEWRQKERRSRLSEEELDELYRLPTDHLQRQSHDYSNHRLQQRLKRDQDTEPYEGACGGGGHEELSLSDEEASIVLHSSFDFLPPLHRQQQHRPLPGPNSPVLHQDPLSSPEAPSSPRGRQSGARPKKSPKKQRAL